MASRLHDVLVVGLGTIARTHLKILEEIPDARVVAGVDTADKPPLTFRGAPIPVYPTISEARHHAPGTVIIATPTPAHAAVCGQVADSLPAARILVEKPAADNLADAHHILAGIGQQQTVDVAYHMSFSPEVDWGLRTARARAIELGRPAAIVASFTDPYQDRFEQAQATLGSSWIDSGINSLSVLNKFTELTRRRSLRHIGENTWSAYEARVTCAGSELEALILTSWHVTDGAKTTRIRYTSGDELIMDHTAVAGCLIRNGEITDFFGSDRSIPRSERHYRALYKWWFTDGKPIASTETHLRLHNLLLSAP